MRSFFSWALCTIAFFCYTSEAESNQIETSEKSTLTFKVSSDSTGTTARHVWIKRYDDATCTIKEKGKKLISKPFAKLSNSLGPVNIESNKIATIGIIYIEARIMQNRECSHTVNFLPEPGKSYFFNFSVSEQSMRCEIKVEDSTGAPVPITAPEHSCAIGMVGRIKNGQPGILDYKYIREWN